MADKLISYDPSGVFLPEHGITPAELADLAGHLDEARDEVLADAQLWADGVEVPAEKVPLDAGFHDLPDRLLADFRTNGPRSELARIKAAADRLSGEVDSVVVLGIGGSYMGARALLEACCHQYYNEVEPAMRRGRPRMYFEGNNVDNDALLDLQRLLQSRGDQWGLVCISKSGGTLETAAAFRILLHDLKASLGKDSGELAKFVIPVTGKTGKLFELSQALGCKEVFEVPDGVGGRFSVLSAVGLTPAALLGLDLERLLAGAAAMNEHFRNNGPATNIVLQYVGVCHLMEELRGCYTRVLSTWGKRLEAASLWYDQLLAESLGKHEVGALPLTVVNTRDLHSRGQQHQEGARDKLITNLIVDQPSRGAIKVGSSDLNQDGLNELAEKSIPNILAAAIEGTNLAYREANRPTADIHLPQLDEYTLGQFFQFMMLATVVEGRLIGINPYGQPGVEAYKKNMNAILRR
ncbi:glucose-6-phosphate isomerase [Lacipirellula limnantheis]|uniref:Glucose-6-phosphate isomerase n=1 Tax=Lacipirellula limnantheis TaxID=2528024 RepID=A0A517U5C4_9BACT|nr:glucose-6-phosphate isomerase [Lacipirellula limnantheis]QDT75831.1 Glucose-6-phosphate isomerase [Lacipirellula limnantheis]